jgi:hypothetical protein
MYVSVLFFIWVWWFGGWVDFLGVGRWGNFAYDINNVKFMLNIIIA